MPVSFIVNKLRQSITGKATTDSVRIVARRFIQAFNDHGIQTAQIPRLLAAIKLENLKTEDDLLASLNPEIINQTARLFYQGHRIETMNNNAWQRARRQAGIPDLHIHDLRHTVGMRLREAGVREETIADVLWHTRQGMTALLGCTD